MLMEVFGFSAMLGVDSGIMIEVIDDVLDEKRRLS